MGAVLDTRALRNALGAFPTGVCLVTTRGPDGRCEGVTINSFASVSLDPPMVLWSLACTAPSLARFSAAPRYAIHVLSAEDEAVSRHFARPAEDKFAAFAGRFADDDGLPLLTGAAATFVCRNTQRHPGGDHVVFLGEVERFDLAEAMPLVFHRGRYGLVAHPA